MKSFLEQRKKLETWMAEGYMKLSELTYEISGEPASRGLDAMVKDIAVIREMANWVANMYAQAIKINSKINAHSKYLNNKLKGGVEEVAKQLRDKDPDLSVRRSTNIARDILTQQVELSAGWESLAQQVSDYKNFAKFAYENLNATRDDLLLQLAIIKQQIILGEINAESYNESIEEIKRSGNARIESRGYLSKQMKDFDLGFDVSIGVDSSDDFSSEYLEKGQLSF